MNSRKTLKKQLLALAVTCVLANTTAFADGDHDHDTAQSEEEMAAAAEDAVAMVNGKPISRLALDRVTDQLSAQGQKPNRQQIIDELINLEILTQNAEALELDKDPAVSTALHLQYTQTMANAYLGAFSNDLKISEDDIRAEYEKQIANIKASEYKASHILLDSEDDAKMVIAELANGGDFIELAKTHSTGPTGTNGGDLGWFQPDNMVAEFSAAVAAMEKGATTSEPVKTDFGWHVIKLDDVRDSAKPDYSPAVKSGIQSTLLRDALANKVEELRAAATVEIK